MSIQILQFFSVLGNGGAENRMMDVYRCMNPDKIKFDFAVVHDGKHHFDDEVLKKGSKKYLLPDPRMGLVKNYKELVKFFKKHPEFQAVHAHVAWYSGVVLLAAKQAGIKVRIAHARDSVSSNRSFKQKIICDIGKLLIDYSATQKIAISKEAAENIFGKRTVKKGDFLFVPNSIDQNKYVTLNEEEREKLRERLGIPAKKRAYVTVANLRSQKNHVFLMDIVDALKDKRDDFILYLIGEGDLREEIEEKIKILGIEDNVVLMGSRGDVPKILCAFDGMIFPSLFEGLGGVVLEAQLVGVPCVVSEGIPKVVDVGINMVEYVSLKESPKMWAKKIIGKFDTFNWNKDECLNAFREKGYCIEETTRRYLREYGIDEPTINEALIR